MKDDSFTSMKITPFEKIKKELQLIIPEIQLLLLPKKWEKIGDVLIIKLDDKLAMHEKDIGKVYANILGCKSVLNDKGGITGTYRKPILSHIYGDRNTITTHNENGILFQLDPQKIMFSSGNIDERERMGTIADKNETIIDLFAGIGYFTIPMAVYSKPLKIYACEINPTSFSYLKTNIKLNKVDHIIEPLIGDNRVTAPVNIADRVIMGYFGETKIFLRTALNCLKNHFGIIHYHDTFPDKKIPDIALKQIIDIAKENNRKVKLLHYHQVKSYAPGIGHYVFDVSIVK